MKRFTAYRRDLSNYDASTHTSHTKNADDEPQFEGVIFSDGTVAVRWLTECASTSVWPDLITLLHVHGHPEYGTEIEWHDSDMPEEWRDIVEKYHATLEEINK